MKGEWLGQAVKTIDYTERPRTLDFGYYTTSITGAPSESVLLATQVVNERFGISVKHLSWGEVPQLDGRVPYVLVDTGGFILPTLPEKDQAYVGKLAQLPGARVNLIATFAESTLPDRNDDYGITPQAAIPIFDKQYGVNTIFADAVVNGFRTNSAEDISDNIVCETIRLKVEPIRNSSQAAIDALQEAQELHAEEIEEFRWIYNVYGLFHRSETDGAVVLRTANGFLTTQTKTDKTMMLPANFSLVHGWSGEDNTVTFTGEKIPTSDMEMLVALDKLGKFRIAAHFHRNEITRGRKFDGHKTVNPIEYGRFESGGAIKNELERIGDDWIILKEHGVLWFGDTVEEFRKFVTDTLKISPTEYE